MINSIAKNAKRPALYEKSTAEFWNDPHISKGMLEAHLHPDWDAATRKHSFVQKSVDWISSILPPEEYPKLLDIGCGPGIYAEKFIEKAYNVTGMDFSERSINYARNSAMDKGLNIQYLLKDYLTLDYENEFDIITLIYCDFGPLSDDTRKLLLKKIHRALKPKGKFIFDVFTPKFYKECKEKTSWEFNETGFFSGVPHINLYTFYRYDEDSTVLDQNIIVTENSVNCYNLWKHTFTVEELKHALNETGFSKLTFYDDVAGAKYSLNSDTICTIAEK